MSWLNRITTMPESIRKLQPGKALGRMITIPDRAKVGLAIAGALAQAMIDYKLGRDPVSGVKKGEKPMEYIFALLRLIGLLTIDIVQLVEDNNTGNKLAGLQKKATAIQRLRDYINCLPIPAGFKGAIDILLQQDWWLGRKIDDAVQWANDHGYFGHASTPPPPVPAE